MDEKRFSIEEAKSYVVAALKETLMEDNSFSVKDMMTHRFDEQDKHLEEIKEDGKKALEAIKIQNGRITRQEEWSKEAQKVIENTTKIANETYTNYKTDKTRIWAVIGVLIFLGGTIITLSIMAIDSKIRDGISQALADNISKIYEEK